MTSEGIRFWPVETRPISFRAAAALLDGFGDTRAAESRLRRYVFDRERKKGHPFVARGSSPKRVRCTVTMADLRAHCPALFRTKEDLQTRFVRRDELARMLGVLSARVQLLEKETEELRKGLESHEKVFARVRNTSRNSNAQSRGVTPPA